MNESRFKTYFILTFLLLASLLTASAQTLTRPTFAVSGGYSGYNPGGTSSGVRFSRLPMGWLTTAQVNFTPRYSFIADFGGYSDSKIGSTHTYLFGPRFNFHKGRLSPFAEVMMGAQHLSAKGQPSYMAFTEAAGGGLDIAVARRVSVRLFQADFIYAADHEKGKLALNQFYGVRMSAGIAWYFGHLRRPTVAEEKSPAPQPERPAIAAAQPESKPTEAPPIEAKAADVKAENAKPAEAATAEVAKAESAEPAKSESAEASQSERATVATAKTEAESAKTKTVEIAKTEPAPAPPEIAKAEPAPAPAPVAEPAPAPAPAANATASASPTPAAEPSAPAVPASAQASTVAKASTPVVQQVAQLRFPYDQYPSLLSVQDKRALDALAARMKLEPDSKAAIVGSASPKSGKLASQRAVNSKDYLLQKGIASERVETLQRTAPLAPRSKTKPVHTELVFVPAGASYTAADATPVDEQAIHAEHLHVAHPEWHEK